MRKGDVVEVRFVDEHGGAVIGVRNGRIVHLGKSRAEVAVQALSGTMTLGIARTWLKPDGSGGWVLEQLSVRAP